MDARTQVHWKNNATPYTNGRNKKNLGAVAVLVYGGEERASKKPGKDFIYSGIVFSGQGISSSLLSSELVGVPGGIQVAVGDDGPAAARRPVRVEPGMME